MRLQYISIYTLLFLLFGCGHVEEQSSSNNTLSESEKIISDNFSVPPTISQEAQVVMSSFSRKIRNIQSPDSKDIEGWKSFWKENEKAMEDDNEDVINTFKPKLTQMEMGGIPVIDIKPQNWVDNGKILIYTHGGAYTLFSASSTLSGCVPVADETGLRIISIDYTVAPNANWNKITDQVIAVIVALINEGYNQSDIGIYGDSAGGGLAAGAVLKARDKGIGLLGAVVLWSPWSDITENGDTYASLKDADPILNYNGILDNSAAAYAATADQKNPYVSPVYADYSKGFPPTLIQVGSKEIFLSNAIRHYQVLDQAGIDVKIDPYEGMWHVFQAFSWKIPEADIARKKMATFLEQKLDYKKSSR